MAKMLLDKAGIKYEVIDAVSNAEMTQKLGVNKAPTMFVNVNGKSEKLTNVSDIKRYIENSIA